MRSFLPSKAAARVSPLSNRLSIYLWPTSFPFLGTTMALSPIVVAMVGLVLLLLMFGLGATMRDSDIVAVSRRPKVREA